MFGSSLGADVVLGAVAGAGGALDRVLQRHHRAVGDDVHRRRGARLDPAIGREQLERRHLPGGFADQLEPFRRAAGEHVAAEPVAADQPGTGSRIASSRCRRN